MKKKKVLLSGGTGYIGNHLVEALIKRGDEVHLAVRSPDRVNAFDWNNSVTAHEIDIADPEKVRALYRAVQPDEIYHMAGSIMNWGVSAGLEILVRTNILATAVWMEALEVVPNAHFVFPGSFAEIGGKNEAIREDHMPEPQEFYAITKLAGTLEGQQLARNKGYNIVIGRIFTAFGEGQPKNKLVQVIINGALSGNKITLSHPEVTRDLIHVSDIVSLFLLLGARANELRGEIFNVGSGEKTSLEELVKAVEKISGKKIEVEWHPEKRTSYEQLPWQADMTKVRRVLGWTLKLGREDGLRLAIEWTKTHPQN